MSTNKKPCNLFCQEDCREGYSKTTGICYKNCGSDTNVGCCMCRQRCKEGYKDTAGVCWFDKCPAGQKKSGALCYEPCPYNHKEIGTSLCRERCRSGYSEVLGVCWKGLKSYVPKTNPRKSDGKLASYVPKSKAKDSYVPAITMGLYPKILLSVIGALVAMYLVIQLGAFAGVIKSFVVNTSQITKAVFQPLASVLRGGESGTLRRPGVG